MNAVMLERAAGTTERVSSAIRGGIVAGQFVPGQHLVESDLAQRLGISRGSLREALRHLSSEGVIVIHRYRGAHICRLSRREARNLLEVLEQLVRLGARLAVTSSGEKRGLMDAALAAARRYQEGPEQKAYMAVRQAFYDCLFEVAGNSELQRVTPLPRTDLLRAQIRPYQTGEQQQEHLDGYRLVAQTVIDGRIDAADAAVGTLFGTTHDMLASLPDAAFHDA